LYICLSNKAKQKQRNHEKFNSRNINSIIFNPFNSRFDVWRYEITMKELIITLENGRYYVNGKLYKDCNSQEQIFLNNFFAELKWKQ
jgi:hypothetical protein